METFRAVFQSCLFQVEELYPYAKVGVSNGITKHELGIETFQRIIHGITSSFNPCIEFFQTKGISGTNFSIGSRLSTTETIFGIGKDRQTLHEIVCAIIHPYTNTHAVTYLIVEYRPYGCFKVNRIESTLIGVAEQKTRIGFGLYHKLSFFLSTEAIYHKKHE